MPLAQLVGRTVLVAEPSVREEDGVPALVGMEEGDPFGQLARTAVSLAALEKVSALGLLGSSRRLPHPRRGGLAIPASRSLRPAACAEPWHLQRTV